MVQTSYICFEPYYHCSSPLILNPTIHPFMEKYWIWVYTHTYRINYYAIYGVITLATVPSSEVLLSTWVIVFMENAGELNALSKCIKFRRVWWRTQLSSTVLTWKLTPGPCTWRSVIRHMFLFFYKLSL